MNQDSVAKERTPSPPQPEPAGNPCRGREKPSADELLPLVYGELRRLAGARMARQPANHTLQATALVHEAYIRLKASGRDEWTDRAHFFGAAAQAMRQILVENARRKRALRHGGAYQRLEGIDPQRLPLPIEVDDERILEVDEALKRFQIEDPLKAEVVKLRYFVGLNHGEIAELLGLSEKTVRRHWAYAKAWLYDDIRRRDTRPAPDSAH